MRPALRLAIGLAVIACAAAAASLGWIDPEPAVYEAATRSLGSIDIAVASAPATCAATPISAAGISTDLLAAFQIANGPNASLGNVSGLRDRFSIANSAQLAAQESQSIRALQAGVQRVPILRISRVDFSADKTEALLCLRGQFGSDLVHLRKINGAWQVVHEISTEVASTS